MNSFLVRSVSCRYFFLNPFSSDLSLFSYSLFILKSRSEKSRVVLRLSCSSCSSNICRRKTTMNKSSKTNWIWIQPLFCSPIHADLGILRHDLLVDNLAQWNFWWSHILTLRKPFKQLFVLPALLTFILSLSYLYLEVEVLLCGVKFATQFIGSGLLASQILPSILIIGSMGEQWGSIRSEKVWTEYIHISDWDVSKTVCSGPLWFLLSCLFCQKYHLQRCFETLDLSV